MELLCAVDAVNAVDDKTYLPDSDSRGKNTLARMSWYDMPEDLCKKQLEIWKQCTIGLAPDPKRQAHEAFLKECMERYFTICWKYGVHVTATALDREDEVKQTLAFTAAKLNHLDTARFKTGLNLALLREIQQTLAISATKREVRQGMLTKSAAKNGARRGDVSAT